jgi:YfiH family protein
VSHAIFTRQGGQSLAPYDSLNLSVSVPDDRETVYANRKRAYGIFERDTPSVVHAHLVHSDSVARVDRADQGTWTSRVDGIISNDLGCALTMNYADCAPIFVYDATNGAIGLGHAGWKGAVRDLPGAMVRTMQAEFGSDPAALFAGIGPSIGPCCYEVREPVIGAVRSAFSEAEHLLELPDGETRAGARAYFDLPEANRINLRRAGVTAIELSNLCTACRTDLFFSHRAEKGKTGRFGTILLLNPAGGVER